MARELSNIRVAILVEDAFEQSEMTEPRKALDEQGALTVLVSKHTPTVHGWRHQERGDAFGVDVPLRHAHVEDFDALLLPGGVMNADALRAEPEAVEFVRQFMQAGKPVAAICHAPWILIEAGLVKGKNVTSWPSLQTDLRNAGARWVDAAVVEEPGLITSRKPADIPAFNDAMTRMFAAAGAPAKA